LSKSNSIDWFPPRHWIGDISVKSVGSDLLAGLTGTVIVLPQGVAFAIIAGMPPIYGLYSAMIIPIVAALFGSSRHLVTGPATPISLVIFSTVSQYAEPSTLEFVSIAITVTLGAGIIQLLLGLAQLGAMVNFVSRSVIIGFTAGAALLIITSQLQHLFGIEIPRGISFLDSWIWLFQKFKSISHISVGIGLFTLILALLFKRIHKLLPYLLLAMIISSLIIYYFFSDDTSIKLVGKLPQGLPTFSIPEISFVQIKMLAPNAFAIALLGLIEAVSIGRSIAVKSGQRINPNQEFIGQGLGNIAGSLFSGFAGSGSFTRSGINYSSGAVTPMAAVFTSILLMLSISYVAPLAAFLPVAVMAGVIMLVAYNLIEFSHIRKLLLTSRRESAVMIITFLATLFLQLEYAIYLGVFFSLVLYLRQTSKPRFVQISPDPNGPRHMFLNIEKYNLETCPQLMIHRIEGSLFFGAVEHATDEMDRLFDRPEKHLLIVANNINLIDNSGSDFLVKQVKKWNEGGKQIYFCGLKLRSREFLRNGGYVKEIGEDRFFGNKEHAIEEIYKKLDQKICEDCPVQIFRECPRYDDNSK